MVPPHRVDCVFNTARRGRPFLDVIIDPVGSKRFISTDKCNYEINMYFQVGGECQVEAPP